jgi:ABC-type sugar transport system substrate-binding protein
MEDDRITTSTEDEAVTPIDDAVGEPAGAHTRAGFLKRVAVVGAGTSLTGSVLAACGGGGETTTAATVAAAGETVKPNLGAKFKGKTIGFALLTSADENQASIVKWAKQAASDAGLDWTWDVTDTQGDPAAAGTTIGSYITKKVDGMMMVGIGAGSVESQLAKGVDAGIPMIGTYTFAPADSSIAQDFTLPPAADATLLGQYLIDDQLRRHPSGTIEVAMLDFPPNVIQGRRYAFEGIVAQNPRFKIVAKNYTISLTATAQSASAAAQALIRSNPNLKAIWCNYPPIAVPAASGVAQSGKDVQVYGHIANSSGVEAVREGNGPLVATSWVDWPFVGYSLVDQMLLALSGAKPDRQRAVLAPDPAIVFDKTNVEVEVPKGTKAADWMFAGGTYRSTFLKNWNEQYA